MQPITSTWKIGLGIETPFGLTTEWKDPNDFAGRFISTKASLDAFDFLIVAFLNIGKFFGKNDGTAGEREPEFYTLPRDFIREHHDPTSTWQKVRLRNLAVFCRFWRMTPTDVYALDDDEYAAFVDYMREEARAIMSKAGYGPDKRLPLKIATRGISLYKDPAVILASQLKDIWIDAEVDIIETSQWFPRVARKNYSVGLNTTGNGVDDPDQNYFENFSCKSERNYTGYCNPEIEKLMEQQSSMTDVTARKKLVWEIDKKLLEDNARPVVMWNKAAICMQPYVKGYVANVNSVYNGFRYEDVWLDK